MGLCREGEARGGEAEKAALSFAIIYDIFLIVQDNVVVRLALCGGRRVVGVIEQVHM